MQTIEDMLVGLEPIDARSVLYYLSRYLKQAALFDEYGKDIFDDDVRAAPSDLVRSRTLAMIETIEITEGATVELFDEATYVRWASKIEDLESALQGEASGPELNRAAEFLASIFLPKQRRSK